MRLAVGTVCARWDDPASGVGPNKFDTPLLTVAHNDRQLGMPMPTPVDPALATTELYVPAGRPLLLHYTNSVNSETKVGNMTKYTTHSCDGVVAFVPEAGGRLFLQIYPARQQVRARRRQHGAAGRQASRHRAARTLCQCPLKQKRPRALLFHCEIASLIASAIPSAACPISGSDGKLGAIRKWLSSGSIPFA